MAIEAHKVTKTSRIRVPGVLDKGGKPSCQYLRHSLFARVVEGTRQQKRTGIIVDAIPMRAIRYAMNGMLKQPGVVAHRHEMIDPHFRRSMAIAQQRARIWTRNHFDAMSPAGNFKRRPITLSDPFPRHGPTA